MYIVGLAYKKGVGKNAFGKFLTTYLRCEAPSLSIKEVSFAAKLKDIAYQLYSWAGMQRGIYYEAHREEKEIVLPRLGKTPRDIWIGIGNKLREVHPWTWIDFALKNTKADILIVTDVRFHNEADAISDMHGWLLKIVRDGIPQGTDPAEVDLDSRGVWSDIIDNNGTLQDLNKNAERVGRLLLECFQNDKTNKRICN